MKSKTKNKKKTIPISQQATDPGPLWGVQPTTRAEFFRIRAVLVTLEHKADVHGPIIQKNSATIQNINDKLQYLVEAFGTLSEVVVEETEKLRKDAKQTSEELEKLANFRKNSEMEIEKLKTEGRLQRKNYENLATQVRKQQAEISHLKETSTLVHSLKEKADDLEKRTGMLKENNTQLNKYLQNLGNEFRQHQEKFVISQTRYSNTFEEVGNQLASLAGETSTIRTDYTSFYDESKRMEQEHKSSFSLLQYKVNELGCLYDIQEGTIKELVDHNQQNNGKIRQSLEDSMLTCRTEISKVQARFDQVNAMVLTQKNQQNNNRDKIQSIENQIGLRIDALEKAVFKLGVA